MCGKGRVKVQGDIVSDVNQEDGKLSEALHSPREVKV